MWESLIDSYKTQITFRVDNVSFSNCWQYLLLITFDNIATQKKGQELFWRLLYFYVFWGAEFEFEVEIRTYPISFGDKLKKRYFQAAEFNNEFRSVILRKSSEHNFETKPFEQQFVGQHRIFMDFEAPNPVSKSDQHNNKQTSDVNFKKRGTTFRVYSVLVPPIVRC